MGAVRDGTHPSPCGTHPRARRAARYRRYRHRRAQKNASERRTKPLRRQRKKAACLRENLSELLSKYGYETGALWVASDKEIIDASKHIRGV